jgi:glycosyltransferase involved in cell wall biosynthesis
VLAQTCRDFEVIVVDDGSTDETPDVMRSIGDTRVRCIYHEKNRGGSAARNTGIRASTGELIAFLDSDDEWLPTKLERQIDLFARSGPDVGLTYTGAVLVFSESERNALPRHRGKITDRLLTHNVVGGTSVGMVRRQVFERVGRFDETLPARQDLDMWLRISEHFLVDYVPECLVRIYKPRDDRRITNGRNRVKARELFLHKHRDKLVRSRLVHRYLRESGRACHRMAGDVQSARQLYLEAIRARPTSLVTYVWLLTTYMPERFYRSLARCGRRVLFR